MSLNGSVAYSSSDPFGIQNIFKLPTNAAGTPSGLITPNTQNAAGQWVDRPSRLYFALGMLTNTYPIYLKLYDKASAPVVGTDIPLLTLPLTSNTIWNGTTQLAAPLSFEFSFADIGISFKHGIGYSITKLPADADATAILAGDVTGLNIAWQ